MQAKLSQIITDAGYKNPNPYAFTRDVAGLDRYLKDAGIVYFSGKELATPNHPEIASKQGWKGGYLIPPFACWVHGLACLTVADAVRAHIGLPTKAANWWRPDPYNAAVATSGPNSDHPNATAIDLEFLGAEYKQDHAKAAKYLKDLYHRVDWLSLGIYPAGRRIHIGVCTPAGRRLW